MHFATSSFFLPKLLLATFTVSLWLSSRVPLLAQMTLQRDLVGENLFPPEFVLRNAEQIDLSNQQRNALMKLMREGRDQMQGDREKLMNASRKLTAMLDAVPIKEDQMLAQLEEVMRIEREIKRAQLLTLARMKNELSAKQHERLRVLLAEQRGQRRGNRLANQPPGALNDGMERVRQGVERWHKEGRDPSAVMETMKRANSLLEQDKHAEAEILVNEAVQQLERGAPARETAPR